MNKFEGYAGFDGRGGYHGKGGHGGNQYPRAKTRATSLLGSPLTSKHKDFLSETSSNLSYISPKQLKNYPNFGNHRHHGNQNIYNAATLTEKPNMP